MGNIHQANYTLIENSQSKTSSSNDADNPQMQPVSSSAAQPITAAIEYRSRRQSGGNFRANSSGYSDNLLACIEPDDSAPAKRITERKAVAVAEKIQPGIVSSLAESGEFESDDFKAEPSRLHTTRDISQIVYNRKDRADADSKDGADADSSNADSKDGADAKRAMNVNHHAEAKPSEKLASNSSGITSSTEITASRLLSAKDHLVEHAMLEAICIGETKKVTNTMGFELKRKLHSLNPTVSGGSTESPGDVKDGNNSLVVGVYDITGSNARQGVANLEVSGAISTTKAKYTLIFRANIVPESDQFRLSLYGRKRVVAKWKDVGVLSEDVIFKPSPTLKPNASLIFHNAKNDQLIAATGKLTVSSRDDPRSEPGSPFFADFDLPYDGRTAVQLPKGRLSDGAITITPHISGFSNKVSVKFLLWNGEFNSTELKMNLSPSDLSGSEWRVVLNWGTTPSDLDLYCVTNLEYVKARMIYFRNYNRGGSTDASKGKIELNVDVTTGEGPETITFTPFADKKYRFFVRNFSNESPLSNSGANIIVHKGDGDTKRFDIPTDIVIDGGKHARYWNVFDLVDGEIRISNEVVSNIIDEQLLLNAKRFHSDMNIR